MIAAKFGSGLPSWEQSITTNDCERAMDNDPDEAISVEREEPMIEVEFEIEVEDSDLVEKTQDWKKK